MPGSGHKRFGAGGATGMVAAVLLVLACSCSDSETTSDVFITVVTDYTPVTEFDRATITMQHENGGQIERAYAPMVADDFAQGVEVAVFRAVPSNQKLVNVSLWQGETPVAQTSLALAARGTVRRTIVLRRNGSPVNDAGVPDAFIPKTDPFDEYEEATIPGANDPNFVALARWSSVIAWRVGAGEVAFAQYNDEYDCPRVTANGNTLTFQGGCTDDNGSEWFGTAIVVGDYSTYSNAVSDQVITNKSASYTFDGFGVRRTVECGNVNRNYRVVLDGTSEFVNSAGVTTFSVNLTFDTGEVTTGCSPLGPGGRVEYTGTISGPELFVATYAGNGRLGLEGLGKVDISTQDEEFQRTECLTAALSGFTEVAGKNGTLKVTYDGCPMTGSSWAFNGQTMGRTDVDCSVSSRPSGFWIPVLLGALLLRRRRSAVCSPRRG